MMGTLLFILNGDEDLSHEEWMQEWQSARHIAKVKKIKNLQKWVQNEVQSKKFEDIPDAAGKWWFPDDTALNNAMGSEQLQVAADAARFFDMQRSYPLVVRESVLFS